MPKFDKVLLIEDEPITQLICKKLIEISGFASDTIIAGNGEEALNILKNTIDDPVERPGVIFLDINMPVMNGWEFLDNIAVYHNENKLPPIYILSSTVDPEDIISGRSYPYVVDFISKPLTKEHLDTIAAPVAKQN